MFLGHIAVGFAGKRVAPKTSLGALVLAPLFLVHLLWTLGVIGILAIASPVRAQGPLPPSPTEFHPPTPIPRLDPAIAERLSRSTTAWVYEVDSLPAPGCTPRASVAEDTILCHAVRSATAAPGKLWISDMASYLGASQVQPNERPLHADVAVRFLVGKNATDVLVSVRERRILLASMDPTIVEILSENSFPTFLRILRRALPKNQTIEGAIQELDASRSRPNRGPSKLKPLWPDCSPGPEEGQFVYYEDEPVPIHAPEPVWPTGAKRDETVKVTLHAFVDPSGRICYATVIKGAEPFASSAIEAVRHWTFKPAMSGGKAVGVWVEVPFTFKP